MVIPFCRQNNWNWSPEYCGTCLCHWDFADWNDIKGTGSTHRKLCLNSHRNSSDSSLLQDLRLNFDKLSKYDFRVQKRRHENFFTLAALVPTRLLQDLVRRPDWFKRPSACKTMYAADCLMFSVPHVIGHWQTEIPSPQLPLQYMHWVMWRRSHSACCNSTARVRRGRKTSYTRKTSGTDAEFLVWIDMDPRPQENTDTVTLHILTGQRQGCPGDLHTKNENVENISGHLHRTVSVPGA